MRRLRKSTVLLLAGPLLVLGTLWPSVPAHATPGAASCTYSATVHLSNGMHSNPTIPANGVYNLFGTVVCSGSITAVTSLGGNGNYASALPLPSFVGAWWFGVGCTGVVAGEFLGPIATGTLANVNCPPLANAFGSFASTIEPNPLTFNTCGAPAGAGDVVTCDLFVQGTMAFAGTA